jgi:hypothetical protein
MSVLRYVAPSLSTLLGLYCVIWGLVASSYPTSLRVGGAFLGILLLLLAFVYVRVIFPQEQAGSSHSSTPRTQPNVDSVVRRESTPNG